MSRGFATGEPLTWRIIWFGRVWWALPVIAVEDGDLIALYTPPETPFMAGGIGENPRPSADWALKERVWSERPVLQLTRPGEAYSLWVFWTGLAGDLAYWYVNLQEPLRRTSIGFDTRDNMLDIVVDADLSSWRWKDEDDLADAVRRGLISRAQAATVRDEGERVAALLDAGILPFDRRWARWMPDPAWKTPTLRPGWDQNAPAFGEAGTRADSDALRVDVDDSG